MECIIVFVIVSIHEAGHFFAAKIFKWNIIKIKLWMFGGVMETDEYASRSLREDIIVTLAGPSQHIWLFFLLQFLEHTSSLSPSLLQFAYQYNWTIFLFNLLPILPLDGGKLWFSGLSFQLPFRIAHTITIVTSSIFILIVISILIYQHELAFSTYLLFAFLFWENRLEWKQRFYIFIRFLINREDFPIEQQKQQPIMAPKQTKLIDLFSQFRRDCYHEIFVQDSFFVTDEQHCLHTYFYLKGHHATVEDVIRQKK